MRDREPLQAGWVRWTLRLPRNVQQAIEEEARANRRSVNNQIVVILEAWLVRREYER
jgi:hypothetical protein